LSAGDEGAPLVHNGFVMGIFSYGGASCEGTDLLVYTAIYPYYDWINEKLKLANNDQPWA
jgi:secreted trypsin-like serine protease